MTLHVTLLGFPFSVVFLFLRFSFFLSSSFKQVDHQQHMPLLLSMADDCRSVSFSLEMLAVLARQSSSQFEGFMNAFVNGLP